MKNSLKVLLGILLSLCLVMAISCVQQDPESVVTPPESESIVESETQSTPRKLLRLLSLITTIRLLVRLNTNSAQP